MTRRTNARIAGFTYLFYIAVAFPSMVLFNRATAGEGIAAKLAGLTGDRWGPPRPDPPVDVVADGRIRDPAR